MKHFLFVKQLIYLKSLGNNRSILSSILYLKYTQYWSLNRVSRHADIHKHQCRDIDVSISDLFFLPGMLIGKHVTVLKDDGSKTNVLSSDFERCNSHILYISKGETTIRHSDTNLIAASFQVFPTVIIGEHVYKSNLSIASIRYDVILGIPWHVQYLSYWTCHGIPRITS